MFALALTSFVPLDYGNFLPWWVSYLLEVFSIPLFSMASQDAPKVDREMERKLVEEALSGGPGFEKLVRAYERMVYRVAYRFVNNETDASDVTQEVFFRVYKSLSQFRGESALSTWIYTITANLSRNAIRSKRNREKVQVLAPEEKEEDRESFWAKVADPKEAGSLRLVESSGLNKAIQAALQQLPEDYREAVILRDVEDLDYQDIALVLKTSLGTVKSRIARGRSLMREQLKDWV